MTDAIYGLRNITTVLPEKLAQYLEAQYHIWDESLVASRRALIRERGTTFAEPYLEATPAYVSGRIYNGLEIPEVVSSLLMRAALDPGTGVPAVPYLHQAKALEAFFRGPTELVVSTGTGSGKTETFLMPILGALAIEKTERPASYALPATRALLLYPMNALVNDQVSRLRRLLGADVVADALTKPDGFRPTFGMYTSRTPYPGLRDQNKTTQVVGGWIDDFFVRYAPQRQRLQAEGKWPAKDLLNFRKTFSTSPRDSELLTRHEMHDRPPDLLVTNYSMLEYMLLRPVDAAIFASTRDWLAEDDRNYFTVVLDEAHLYQGAQGTEVALLLRRLVSRLRVSRERIRFILTSASLSTGTDAAASVRTFASQLTGAPNGGARFDFIQGELDRPAERRPTSVSEAEAFAELDVDALLQAEQDLGAAHRSASRFAKALGAQLAVETSDVASLRNSLYSVLSTSVAAMKLSGMIMAAPKRLAQVATDIFPQHVDAAVALDGLLAACAFARRSADGRALLPMRAHLLFRGLVGVYACVNPQCSAAGASPGARLLGKVFAQSRLRCDCGSRVYELLTHRDCGAAYLRAFFRPASPTFLWHQPSTGLSAQGHALAEVHLLVEHPRDQVGGSNCVWLHKRTGRLVSLPPAQPENYLELRQPAAAHVMVAGRAVVTFDGQCPVCRGRWQDRNRPKIMDLATKGEDPFSHLIANQVRLQPPSRAVTRATPNAGRKSLLFSDGRQKAARLARDVPRVIEQDAFRQVSLLAADRLRQLSIEPRISDAYLYTAFISIVSTKLLRFFDGPEAEHLQDHLRTFEDPHQYGGNLEAALSDPWQVQSPQSFRMHMMRVLGSAHYSLYALGLGYVRPRKMVITALRAELAASGLAEEDIDALSIVWIQGCLDDMSLYGRTAVTRRSRTLAAGYPIPQAGTKSGFSAFQKKFLAKDINVGALEIVLRRRLTDQGDGPDLYLLGEDRLLIEPAISHRWVRCRACTYLAPVSYRGRCAACGSSEVTDVPPGGDVYLRARKAFWRDPAERVLAGSEDPMTLDVEEHTAQLGFRDLGDLEATTESYERRFRDILIGEEVAIDVLSCTTTMEVGIDIGSLVAVGLRNMPPSRHNYQQRAGRAGRRGSAVSTVVTFAQNNAHDSFLFDHPEELISGQSKLTGLDVGNPALVSRHASAEILQEFFEDTVVRRSGGNIFAALGDTVPFFTGTGDGSLDQLRSWLATDPNGAATLSRIEAWIPADSKLSGERCGARLLGTLDGLRAAAAGVLPRGEERLIEFLFARGVLPAYAFPRDLVALQIDRVDAHHQVQIIERPQQGAHIALSEYAPGRLVVINKRTYRVGAVTADLPPTEVNRAAPLFVRPATYLQCPNCLYTADPAIGAAGARCPVCALAPVQLVTVIQPEVVWPEGGAEISELDDDQTVTDTTVAQLPVPASNEAFDSDRSFGPRARLLHGRQVPLIIMNRGELGATGPTGFQVCSSCGYTALGGQAFPARHERHYHISRRGPPVPM